MVAAAQILSTFKEPESIFYIVNGKEYSTDIDWNRIMSDCDMNPQGYISSQFQYTSTVEISHLYRYLGIAFDVEYHFDTNPLKNTSGAKMKDVCNWMKDYSGLKVSDSKEYNESDILTSLREGYAVYASGKSKRILLFFTTGGHAWVYDGFMKAKKNNKYHTLVHCNWGWDGIDNGYYLSKMFDIAKGAQISDQDILDMQTGEVDVNFKYDLKYFTIKKR